MTVSDARGTRATVAVDGCEISYLRGGTGPALLLLHGAGGNAGWYPFMDRLAERYDVIVPDHPGWGYSAMPEWFDNVHDIAYFYLDFIQALGLHDVHLVGHSMGGWIACEIAVRNTHDLATLTLIAPAGLRVKGVKRMDIFLASPETIARALYYDKSLAEPMLAQAPSPKQVDIILRNRFASARLNWEPRLYDPHLAKWLHRIDVPTLIVWGENDEVLPVAMQAEFLRLIPRAKTIVLPQCGHVPPLEQPEAFVTHFNRFVQGASR